MLNIKLKQLRSEKGITQEELAKIMGVERSTIGKYESPNKPITPPTDVLLRLCDYFNVSVDYLLGRDEKPQKTVRELLAENKQQYAYVAGKGMGVDVITIKEPSYTLVKHEDNQTMNTELSKHEYDTIVAMLGAMRKK